MKHVIEISRAIIKNKKIDVAIDMTLGRGKDLEFLVEISNKVYGFDIQKDSIDPLIDKYKNNDCVKLILDNHVNVERYVSENIDLCIYNLGYLPGSDKKITTNYISTISSLNKILNLLKKDAQIHIVCYPGHSEGKIEAIHLREFIKKLPQDQYSSFIIEHDNAKNNPPFLIVISKR